MISELEAIYVDTGTDLTSFGAVKVGMPTRHELVFVLLDQAAVGPGYLRVCYDKSKRRMPRRSAPAASCPRETKRRSSSTTAWPTSRAAAVSGSWPAARAAWLSGGSDACLLSFYCW
jgi:hypothetical protein